MPVLLTLWKLKRCYKKGSYGFFNMREVFCERYSECLTIHAKSNTQFDCEDCQQSRRKSSVDIIEDMKGIIELLAAIFFPELFQIYVDETKEAADRKGVLNGYQSYT
jgi:hypothetical protein